MSSQLRVLVADDSPTSREHLVRVLSRHPGLTVVGAAHDGLEAVAMTLRLRPSVVVMDVVMPELDGFEATARIMTEHPTPVVVVTSALDPADVALALRSVEVGALTVLPKPTGGAGDDVRRGEDAFAQKVAALAQVGVIRRYRRPPATKAAAAPAAEAVGVVDGPRGGRDLVAVAASTGGPRAVHDLLAVLPVSLPVPILVVQHIADGFIEGYAQWLGTGTDLTVQIATHGHVPRPGTVYVAAEGRHLCLDGERRLVLDEGPPVGGFRPAATRLFESAAATHGSGAVGVILTGLGSDGLDGLTRLHDAGGVVLAQDEASSAVFGMPGVVVAAGLADAVAPPEVLAQHIIRLTSKADT